MNLVAAEAGNGAVELPSGRLTLLRPDATGDAHPPRLARDPPLWRRPRTSSTPRAAT